MGLQEAHTQHLSTIIMSAGTLCTLASLVELKASFLNTPEVVRKVVPQFYNGLRLNRFLRKHLLSRIC